MRELLRFHQPLSASGRAADVVRVGRTSAIEGMHDRLGVLRRQMQRTRPEVDHLLGMAERPGPVQARRGKTRERPDPDVSRIRARGRVAAQERATHRVGTDRAGETAAADAVELAVPVLQRQPGFETDLRIGRRPYHPHDPAVRRQRAVRDGRGERDRGVRKMQAGEAGARSRVSGWGLGCNSRD